MGFWFLWNVLFVKPSLVWASTLCPSDNLEKHMGKWQVEHNVLDKSLKKVQAYYEKNNKHYWNLVLFVVQWPQYFLQQVGDGMAMENYPKNVQFIIFHIM
jgi:hypothetical protein